jgi:hypothetical protein
LQQRGLGRKIRPPQIHAWPPSAIRSPAVRPPAQDDSDKHARL